MKVSISIIMATYNRAHFILEMLNSISVQTFKSWECLIIDDGGTDDTEIVISNLLNQDDRFKYLNRTDNYKKGLCGSRNYGLDIASGEYIVFFDDDDFVHPKALEIAYNEIKKKNNDFCHYQKQSFFNERPKFRKIETEIECFINTDNLESVVTGEIGLASCTVLWKKECFSNIRFNEELHYAEEWECYIKIISNGFKGVMINDVLYFNRKHKNSNTGEFWSNNIKRINSKKDAIYLVVKGLKNKKLLSNDIQNYLVNLVINFRDITFLREVLLETNLTTKSRLIKIVKFYLFPFWKIKKTLSKSLKIKGYGV